MVVSLMLCFAINAQADGMSESQAMLDNINIQSDTPAPDQYVQMLANGQMQMWDSQAGLWRFPGDNLRFDPDQQVSHNRMGDGRVLFFATRNGGNTPDYQARVWNPQSGRVEKVMVSAKAKFDSDIAVLTDGRVLIVNGDEGSADIWDSRTNTVLHGEEPLLENSRWRILPLKNKQALLMETFPDEFAAIRSSTAFSAVLLWNPDAGEWKQLASLPAPFMNSGSLVEHSGGLIQAESAGGVYRLASIGGNWEMLPTAAQSSAPLLEQMEIRPDGSRHVIATPASKNLLSSKQKNAVEVFSWDTYMSRTLNDLWLMAVFVPVFIFIIGTWGRAGQTRDPFIVRSAMTKLFLFVMVFFVATLTWVLQRHASLEVLQSEWGIWRLRHEEGIQVLAMALMLLAPFAVYFAFRRLEKNGHATFLRHANFFARAIGIGFVVLILLLATLEDWGENGPVTSYSWWALSDNLQRIFLAAFIPAVLYLFLRYLEKRKFANIAKYATRTFVAVAIGFFTLLALSGIYNRSESNLASNVRHCKHPSSLGSIKQWVECVEADNGLLENLLFKKTKEVVLSLPSVPCRYVGIWSSKRPYSEYQVTLTDDSRYIAVPIRDDSGNSKPIYGIWGARDDRMVWFEDDRNVWPIDINTIHPENRSRFSLIEVNGERTNFELIDAIKSNSCTL